MHTGTGWLEARSMTVFHSVWSIVCSTSVQEVFESGPCRMDVCDD